MLSPKRIEPTCKIPPKTAVLPPAPLEQLSSNSATAPKAPPGVLTGAARMAQAVKGQSHTARESIRRRLSMSQYDNMLIYQYYEQALEDIANGVSRMDRTIADIRSEMMTLIPQEDINTKWQAVIRRLELLSLVFYVSVLFATMYLFFYHDWYCAIGHNPCGQSNLKCPWMAHTPDDPHCEHNSYN